jgi:hypothetical protein
LRSIARAKKSGSAQPVAEILTISGLVDAMLGEKHLEIPTEKIVETSATVHKSLPLSRKTSILKL